MDHIWQRSGHPVRAGFVGHWRCYEKLPWPKQQMLLNAAATALDLIEAGDVTGHGTLAQLLTPEPHRPVPDGAPPVPAPRDYWEEARDAKDEAIALAQHDPAAGRQLLTVLTSMTLSEASFQRTREGLIAAGIPDDHLPPTLAETHPPKTRTGSDATVTY